MSRRNDRIVIATIVPRMVFTGKPPRDGASYLRSAAGQLTTRVSG